MRTCVHSGRISCVTLIVIVSVSLRVFCLAQEIGSADLTKVMARVDLRHPPTKTRTSGPHTGVDEIYLCSDSAKTTGELRTTLVGLDRTHYRVGEKPVFEVTIENIGSVPVKVPFSPHLADLQPADPGQKFAYSALVLELWVGGTQWDSNSEGSVILYGSRHHPGTMLTIHPGEWVRVIGEGHISVPTEDRNVANLISSGDAVDHANAKLSLYQAEMLLAPTSGATVSREVCLHQSQGRSVPITVAREN